MARNRSCRTFRILEECARQVDRSVEDLYDRVRQERQVSDRYSHLRDRHLGGGTFVGSPDAPNKRANPNDIIACCLRFHWHLSAITIEKTESLPTFQNLADLVTDRARAAHNRDGFISDKLSAK